MKKYLSLAFVLGAIAFLSVSFLAQAQPETGKVTTAVEQAAEIDATAAPAVEAPATTAGDLQKDAEECATAAATPATEGAALTEEEKTAAKNECLKAKGHSEEHIKSLETAVETTEEAPAAE